MAPDKTGFFDELKRRHVWRIAIAYAVTAWVILQLASIVLPSLHAPDWVLRVLMFIIVILFPVALILAWAFEITPDGVRRTEPADSAEARAPAGTRSVGRKLNTGIIVALVIAVLLLLGNQFLWHRGMRATTGAAQAPTSAANPARSPDAAQRTASAGLQTRTSKPARRVSDMDVANNPGTISPDSVAGAAASGQSAIPAPATSIPQKSVAVLPFTNESGDKDQQFFSDGLSENLINALSQFEGLKVISRNSAFQFRGSKDSSAKIGLLLGVAHLLEGSVQRAGDEVRITAALVNASDGSIVWSQRYDKPYKDLFALQDAISQAVAGALKAKLLTAPGAVVQSDRPPGGSLEAYTAYQHGMAYATLGTEAAEYHAIDAYHEAIRSDPKYAAAYARLAGTWVGLAGRFLSDPAKIAGAKAAARKASATALQLDPDSALAHGAHASLLLNLDMDWSGAEAERRRALQLAPNDAEAQFGLGYVLATLGRNASAVELTRQALASDPRNAGWYYELGKFLAALGKPDAARAAIDTALALQPGAVANHEQLTVIEILRGDAEAALAAARQEPPGPWRAIALALASQIGPDRAAADASLAKLIEDYASVAAFQVADVYALRRDPDNTFKWLDRAWTNRDSGIASLLRDPLILRYQHDPRFAAFCKKVGLPTTTDAVAMK